MALKGGTNAARALEALHERPVTPCDGAGCLQAAFSRVGASNLCLECQAAERRKVSEQFCAERGLDTVEAKREFCKTLARKFGRGPSFEEWARSITQKTVDIIERMGGKDVERTLDRLRAAGAIDGRNKVIPMEAREVAAAAHRAERARLICETEAYLEARRRETEELAKKDREAAP